MLHQKNLIDVADKPLFSFKKEDICNYENLPCISQFKPNFIVNFAAESHVDNSITSPKIFMDTNIFGTFNLLEIVRHLKSKNTEINFIHVSTDEVYGSLGETGKFTESSPYKPNSPYSASKACSDHLVRAWFETYEVPSVITNCCNNFGPRQHTEKFIPKIINSLLNDKKMTIYATGSNVREWIFVDDHNEGLLKIVSNFEAGRKYNIGSGVEKSNMEVFREVFKQLTSRGLVSKKFEETYVQVEDRAGHDFRYALDSSNFQSMLGWEAKTSFEEAISITIDHYITKT